MPEPKPVKRRPLRLILALAGVVLVAAAALAYLNRRAIAREALVGWLQSKGIASDAQVEAFGPTTFTARMRIGDPKAPDFAAERVAVRYRPKLTGIEITSVTLTKPLLRAAYRGGKLGMGSLDPLVREFFAKPPPPDVKLPRMQVDGGVLVLTTDYGPARVTGDILFDDGKLQSLAATTAPMRVKAQDLDVSLGAGTLRTIQRAGRVDLSAAVPISEAKAGATTARDAQLVLTAQLPYPDLVKRRGDGMVIANAHLTAKRLDLPGQSLDAADLSAALTGQATGWIPDLAVTGKVVASLRAGAGRLGASGVKALSASAVAPDFRWTRRGGDRVSATVQATGGVEGLQAGDLRLTTFTASAEGSVAWTPAGATAGLTGSAIGKGGYSGLPKGDGDLAAISRAARSFRIAAPGLSLKLKDGFTVGLPQPVKLIPDSGGAVTLAARPGVPVFGAGGGAFRLTVAGGGLPDLEADVSRLALTANGAVATGSIKARASLAMVRDGDVDASGRLTLADGAITFAADRCIALKVQKLELGANDIDAFSGRFCPTGGPVFAMQGGDWRLAGRVEAVAAAAPFAQVRVASGAGRLTAASRRGRLSAQGHVDTLRLEDTAPATRFNPLLMAGDISLADFLWKARLTARRPGGAQIAHAELTHDSGLGIGLVVLETETLTFAEGGLQPAQLSPLASALGSPVTGSAIFKGRFDWAAAGASSSGSLSIPALNFTSPAGPIEGLKGEIAFTSLAPLIAAPGQELHIDKVAAIVPLTDVSARFELAENLLKIAGGEATVGAGRVRIENLEAPLTPGAATRGTLIFEGVQLHDLVEASPFGDKVDLDAKVSGRMGFEANGSKVRITGGELKAIQAGRISIDRAALTGVQADTAISAPAAPVVDDPNATFTDFAYQAMENLAFDTLDASIASRDDGRLGVLFHIVGKHDPPTKQQIKLTLMDLIKKRFLGRKLPLPSGTGVNLTLDTTLNLDDLLADYAEYQKARNGSAPVQP